MNHLAFSTFGTMSPLSYKRHGGCLLAAIILLLSLAPLSARESVLLDSGWRFRLGDALEAERPDYNDTFWQGVTLPHCWGWEDAQQGKPYYRGPGWYRRELVLKRQRGKRYFLRFEAAGSVADVYFNGERLGEHRGAFGAFCFEITDGLSASGTNCLAVRVSNAPQLDVAPLSGDFPMYGGLYRPVHLITTGPVDFALTDHASPGVAWLQTSVTRTQAVLDVTAQISNATRRPQPLTVTASVLDADGRLVGQTKSETVASPKVIAPHFLRVIVRQPHLWNGRKDPYLYRAIIELHSTNGLADKVEQPLGLRFYWIDPDKGFFLNGEPYRIRGVCRHQDRLNKGWAISDADMEQDVRLILEMGANAVRCAHYQHSDYFYSLCDKAGLLVWAELPQVNRIEAGPKFEETSRNQLLDLIRQNINHPSIFVWSLFNEIRMEKGYNSADPNRELQDLKIVANGEDPTRPTIAATCSERLPEMNKIPDLLGWNLYPGWYFGHLNSCGEVLDARRYSSRHGGLCLSEYGAGANISQHEDNPTQPRPGGSWHPEEWQAMVHEADWAAIKARPYVWGSFIWNMFDFVSYERRDGGMVARNTKGLITFDRKTKKDAFYFYKANWSEEPVLYITDRRFVQRTNAVTNVKIYSNAKEVELFLNGKSQGTRGDATNCVFLWPNVTLKPGENQVEARAQRGHTELSDHCDWILKTK